MKIKYYLRGIGLGIILTTVILTLVQKDKALTDQDIINKATELGMVMGEEETDDLHSLLEKVKPTAVASDNNDNKTPEDAKSVVSNKENSEMSEDSNVTNQDTIADTGSEDRDAETDADTVVDAKTDADIGIDTKTDAEIDTDIEKDAIIETDVNTKTDNQTGIDESNSDNINAEETVVGNDNKPEYIDFTINKGMISEEVSTLLEKKELINDAKMFNSHIIRLGKSGAIRIGTYTLPTNSTYDQIIDAITKD